MASDSGVIVLYDDIALAEGQKGMFGNTLARLPQVGELDAGALGANLSRLTDQLSAALQRVQSSRDGYELSQFEVAVDLTAKGEVRLLGSVSGEVKGGLKLTFTRVALGCT